MVERASGLVVPVGLEKEPDQSAPVDDATTYDLDGRRRIVLTMDDQRKIDQVVKLLQARGMGIIVACASRTDGKPACGFPMMTENKGLPDAGYGCRCSRVHFTR